MAKRGGFPGGMPGNMNNIMKQGAEKAKQTAFRFFHPDYTVGPGITPDQRLQKQPVAGLRPWPFTAGGELHPALKQTFWKVL